jgi:hypothetical protein
MDELTGFFVVIGLIIFVILVLPPFVLGFILYVASEDREHRRIQMTAESALQQGLRPIPDSEGPSITKRVFPLLQRSEHERPADEAHGPTFHLKVAGRDTLYYEWSCMWRPGERLVRYRAYIVLGPVVPILCVLSKRWSVEKPADPIYLPEDPAFSEAFWILGNDQASVPRFLGPELRQFLLAEARGKGCRFHAGPEGVALIRKGRASESELAQMKATLERLAGLAEAAAKR